MYTKDYINYLQSLQERFPGKSFALVYRISPYAAIGVSEFSSEKEWFYAMNVVLTEFHGRIIAPLRDVSKDLCARLRKEASVHPNPGACTDISDWIDKDYKRVI